MRDISIFQIKEAVKHLSIEANWTLGKDVLQALRQCLEKEKTPLARTVLSQLIENAEIAHRERIPLCQDTGFAVVLLEIGQEVRFVDGDLNEAVQQGIREGYTEGYLRKSIVQDPLQRKNTGDNTPAIVYTEIVSGDKVKVTVIPKGGGSENMSEVRMLPPSAGWKGIERFVLNRVQRAGPNACPPLIVGIGIGGTFEKCAWLAKKALLRPIGSFHPDPYYMEKETELLEKINALGIGPMGYGGYCTALAVHIETYPCHIASLPVAVNFQCHAARHREMVM